MAQGSSHTETMCMTKRMNFLFITSSSPLIILLQPLGAYQDFAALDNLPLEDDNIKERRACRDSTKQQKPRTDAFAGLFVDDTKVLRS
jgi:hypothetical protein